MKWVEINKKVELSALLPHSTGFQKSKCNFLNSSIYQIIGSIHLLLFSPDQFLIDFIKEIKHILDIKEFGEKA